MNPKFYALALFAAAAAGCASVPVETEEQKEERCAVDAVMTGVGQQAKNVGMSKDDFESRITSMRNDKNINQNDLRLAEKGLRKGYAGIEGAHPGIIAQKAFDDCMAGK